MGVEIIKDGFKIKMGRHRTQVTTYENMTLQTTQPIKKDKPKERKPSIPSDYVEFNYYNRMKKRRKEIREQVYNSFEIPNVVMLTLTFDQNKHPEKAYTDLKIAHYEFKKFIQRVNTHYQDFRYISTFSRQGNGNWHYHVMCNFNSAMKNEDIKALWGNGITYITYIDTTEKFNNAKEYLIANLNESAGELKGKHGCLKSDNIEKDIELVSWRAETFDDFVEAFEKVKKENRKILYETRNTIGVKGQQINPETGECFEVTIPDKDMTDTLRAAGFSEWETIYTHLHSAADFSDRFSDLKPATPRPKKKRGLQS
jgi:hypothetical protein